jgi:hypothetical protein
MMRFQWVSSNKSGLKTDAEAATVSSEFMTERQGNLKE